MRPFYHQDVKRFHDKFGLETPPIFCQLPDDLHKFRAGFFDEEYKEYVDACQVKDLATAFDSLIDLIYIICGAALLHGIDTDEFYEMVASHDSEHYNVFYSDEPSKYVPGYLTEKNLNYFCQVMNLNIDMYRRGHEEKDEVMIRSALTGLYQSVMHCSSDMGCTTEMWDELWTDVQRANMSKERALKASDSKRGSAWDVVKPAGWTGPDTEGILNKYLT